MTDHAELPPRSFFNADDLSLLIMEHPDAPQFLAVKIADAHDAALAALVAERDRYSEALGATIALDDLLERRRTRETPEVKRIKMPDESVAEGPVVDIFYEVLDAIKAAADRARAALAQGGEKP